jgi:hypothetical protein
MQPINPLQLQAQRAWLRAHPVLGALGFGLFWGIAMGFLLPIIEGGPFAPAFLLSIPLGLVGGAVLVRLSWHDREDFGDDPLDIRAGAQPPTEAARMGWIALMTVCICALIVLSFATLNAILETLPKARHHVAPSTGVPAAILTAFLCALPAWGIAVTLRKSRGLPPGARRRASSSGDVSLTQAGVEVADSPEVSFGCDYCRDDQNRRFGHVIQIGSDEQRGRILIRCPRCGAFYENAVSGADVSRLTYEEAKRHYPDVKW